MKKVLIMGANPETVSLIKKAKEMGLYTIVTDNNPNAYAKKFADKAANVDAMDVEGLVNLAKEEKISGVVVGVAEALLPTYCKVCEKLHMPCYSTIEKFEIMVRKDFFKEKCREYGVSTIREYTKDSLMKIVFPVIVKPVDSCSSKGIKICYNENELTKAIEYALSFSKSGKYLIEEYMTGDEVISYYVIQDGNPIFVGMCDRYTYKEKEELVQLPISYIFPSKHIDSYSKHSDEAMKNMIKGLGLQNGSIFFQCFVDSNGIVRTYEPGYRLNGAQEHIIISKFSRIDAKELYINFALSGREADYDLEMHSNPKPNMIACKLSPLIKTGKIAKLEGLAEIAKLPDVISVNPSYEVGDTVDGEGTLKQIVCRFFIISDNNSSLITTIKQIYEILKVENEKEENMLIGEFDTDIINENYQTNLHIERKKVALIGMGVTGAPIAHKLFTCYQNDFCLIASKDRKNKMMNSDIQINDDCFKPIILSDLSKINTEIDILIICVKNYDLKSALLDIRKIVTKKTIILPLQNGIYAYEFFKKSFPNNIVLQGYVQGPNTEINGAKYYYHNSGVIHIGSETNMEVAKQVYEFIGYSGMNIVYEENINYMVWKKWMLNVAGNSITALTDADYSLFKLYGNLQSLCVDTMREFLLVANAEGIQINENDIYDIINYYVSYNGSKKTSMLMDVQNERMTENDYLAGTLIKVAERNNIKTPMIKTLYYLLEAKEKIYMEKKGITTMKNLFNAEIEYSTSLRTCMKDIETKMKSEDYAKSVNNGNIPQLNDILEYAIKNTEYYSFLSKIDGPKITDFPVMNKTLLNQHYDDLLVHAYDCMNTHKMHTSGSTGIPFTVVQDLAKRERHIADLKYFGAMAGYLDRDSMCYLRAKPTATSEEQERDNIWQLDICNLNEQNLTDYYYTMIEKKCIALIAYPSTLETAVDFWAQHFSNDSLIKTIISTSEALTDEVKDKLRAFFGENVDIFARYSNTENGILGQETGESGVFTLNWASYYFEILKIDSDEPAESGELGRIIVTDLYNKAFPLIRYDTGDVARMIVENENSLPVFCELLGRRMDLIYDTKGEVVSPFLLCRTMRLSQGIEQWQFIQENECEYILKITSNINEKPNCEREIESFKQTLGEKAKIEIMYVENIPVMNSLKRKLIVSNLRKS